MTNNLPKIRCSQCHRETNHKLLHEEPQNVQDEESGYQSTTAYQIIQCLGCEEISFRTVHSSNDEFDPETGDDLSTIELYPDRKLGHRKAKVFRAVPDNLDSLYGQTVSAFNLGMDVLCAGGLRAMIEGLCADQGVAEGQVPKRKRDGTSALGADGSPIMKRSSTLEGKIEGLAQTGVLTVSHARALHEHRYMGNEALHELRSVPRGELKMAIEIVEQTFATVYELEYKHRMLERRRKKRASL